MMGFPDGWVSDLVLPDVDPRPSRLSRTQALKMIGNAVHVHTAAAVGIAARHQLAATDG